MKKEDAIKFTGIWTDIIDAVATLKWLKSQNKNAYIDYNGKKLYAMFDSIDECYLKVTGFTEKGYKEHLQNLFQDFYEEKGATKDLIERGKKIIYPQLEGSWGKCVSARIDGVYKGEDIKLALEIMEALSQGKSFNEVYKIFSTNHVGGSQEPILNIIASFSPKGPNFQRWVISEKGKRGIDVQTEMQLKAIEARNQELEEELDERANEDK